MNTVETIKIMGLGVVIALLGMIALNRGGQVVNAADAASAGKIIAVTNGGKYFYLVDTESQHIAVYYADDNSFAFAYARRYNYDVGINETERFSRKGYTVKESEKMYKDSLKQK